MIIQKANPHVVPATDEQTYPEIWLHDIRIQTPPAGPGQATVTWTPWQAGTANVSGDPMQFVIPDLAGKMATDPEFQAAWEAVTTVIAKYMIEDGVASDPDAHPPIESQPES